MNGSWAVQVALFDALKGVAVLGGRVYDLAPAEVPFPYLEIGETQALSADVQGRDGIDEFRTLHIWSRYDGQKQLFEIAADIRQRLHATNIGASGRDSAFVTVDSLNTTEDPDGRTQHGILTLRVQHFGPITS